MSHPSIPHTMRAAVFRGKRDVVVEQRAVPELGVGDVLLEVSHCGVCGSDLHFVLDGWGIPGSVEGHEYSGRVVAVGEDVRDWSVGDEVVGGPSPRCGRCEFCRSGRPSLCTARGRFGDNREWQGAFAQYVRVPAAAIVGVPDGLPLRAAALAEPLAVALHGLTRGGVAAGHRVLVTGCGPIGALSIAAAHARGVREVVVSEPHPRRRALAERLGATAVTPDDLVTPGYPGDVVEEPFDVALECSGHAAAMEAALGQLARAGTLVLVGAGMQPPRFDPNRILLNELVVTGAFVYDEDGIARALELLASADFPTEILLEPGDVPLEGLLDAIEGLGAGKIPAKVLIAPNKGDA
jgi:(R,R)-butanediol dehydrogenase/meso-butanediol dehydrogenase/diacetyl reductase